MAFGQRGAEDGGQRFDYVPQGAPNKKQAEKVKLRQAASAAQLSRLALGGCAVALALVLAPFTVIPALQSYALGSGDPAASGYTATLADIGEQRGPAYVKRKLGHGSAADARCARQWDSASGLGFRDSMHCYATYKVSRLCGGEEKQVFLALTEEYFAAENSLAYAHVVNASAGTSQLPAAAATRKSSTDVVQAFRVLAEKGYISVDDFGWSAPSSLRIALNNTAVAETPCSAG
jgi:hypothetical protein